MCRDDVKRKLKIRSEYLQQKTIQDQLPQEKIKALPLAIEPIKSKNFITFSIIINIIF